MGSSSEKVALSVDNVIFIVTGITVVAALSKRAWF